MTSSVYKLEKDLCRCCHAEGNFYNLSEPVRNLGHEEVYAEMLRSSLDVEIKPVPGDVSMMTYTICDACVLRLRDAHSFKQQVVLCEQRFKEMYANIVVEPSISIKEELPCSFRDNIKKEDTDFDDDGFEMRFDDSDDDQPVIKIKVEEMKKTKAKPKAKPKAKKVTKTKAKKSETEAAEAEDEGSQAKDSDEREKKKEEEDPPHTVSEIEGVKHFGCSACHKTFKRKSHFSEHYKHAHKKFGAHFTLTKDEDGTDNYNCNSCGKIWKKFMYFRQHFKTVHQKVISGKCDICNLKLPSAKRARHMEEVHGVPAPMCNICNKKFAFPSQVLRHQKIVHMGEANFECQTCLKRFPTHDRWKRHQIVHSTVREDTCSYCGKSFKWNKSLQAHIRIHLEDRRYVCKICGEAFVHGTSLRYHRNKKHPNSM